jgi:hypothetical protein
MPTPTRRNFEWNTVNTGVTRVGPRRHREINRREGPSPELVEEPSGSERLAQIGFAAPRKLEFLLLVVVEPNRLRTTVQVNDALPEAPVVSVTVTLVEKVPTTLGAPEMAPPVALMCSPVGRPVAEYVSVCPVAESVAWIWRFNDLFTLLDWLPGFVTVTLLADALTVQLNVAPPLAPVASRAVTDTELEPAEVGVPETRPLEALMESPEGSPVAPYVSVWPDWESTAWICRLTAVPVLDV